MVCIIHQFSRLVGVGKVAEVVVTDWWTEAPINGLRTTRCRRRRSSVPRTWGQRWRPPSWAGDSCVRQDGASERRRPPEETERGSKRPAGRGIQRGWCRGSGRSELCRPSEQAVQRKSKMSIFFISKVIGVVIFRDAVGLVQIF